MMGNNTVWQNFVHQHFTIIIFDPAEIVTVANGEFVKSLWLAYANASYSVNANSIALLTSFI